MKKNIVLTGMSGVGKSRIGKFLAEEINWNYLDIDNLIIKREKTSIDGIFNSKGEEYFRNIESLIIEELSSLDSHIISTGGGAILRKENMNNLSKNGYIFLLLGKIETIVDNINKSTTVRPLLSDKNKLYDNVKNLFNCREYIYKSTADIIIEIDGKSDMEISSEILDKYYSLKWIYTCRILHLLI